jgi:hypothetical protein
MSVIICYSRCMWCGRRTPHEWCHDCTAKVNAGRTLNTARPWSRKTVNAEPEVCEFSDDECPQNRIRR